MSLTATDDDLARRNNSTFGCLTFLSSHGACLPIPQLQKTHHSSFPAPGLMQVFDKSSRPMWTVINFCSPNSLWLNFYPTSPQYFCSKKKKKEILPFLSKPPLMPLTSFSPSTFGFMLHQFPLLFPTFNYSFSMDLSPILQTHSLCFDLKANKNRSRTLPSSF